VLGDLKNETLTCGFNFKGVKNLGEFLIELFE
jgi:hypothetical protein